MRDATWLGLSGTDSLGFAYENIAYTSHKIGGLLVSLAKNAEGIFVVAASGVAQSERAIGHRGPFPTEEAALTYLQLVKD